MIRRLLHRLFRGSYEDQEIRRLMKEHPNPDMRVVGRGLVVTPVSAIKASPEYQASLKRTRAFRARYESEDQQ